MPILCNGVVYRLSYCSVSERLTWAQWAEVWSRVLGVKATYVQAEVGSWFDGSGAPEAFVDEFKEAYAYIIEFGYDGGNPDCLKIEQVSHDACMLYSFVLTVTSFRLRYQQPL